MRPPRDLTATLSPATLFLLELRDGHLAVGTLDRDADLISRLHRIEDESIADLEILACAAGRLTDGAGPVAFQRDGAGRLVDFHDFAAECRLLGMDTRGGNPGRESYCEYCGNARHRNLHKTIAD